MDIIVLNVIQVIIFNCWLIKLVIVWLILFLIMLLECARVIAPMGRPWEIIVIWGHRMGLPAVAVKPIVLLLMDIIVLIHPLQILRFVC